MKGSTACKRCKAGKPGKKWKYLDFPMKNYAHHSGSSRELFSTHVSNAEERQDTSETSPHPRLKSLLKHKITIYRVKRLKEVLMVE